jgi:hypothetical protein
MIEEVSGVVEVREEAAIIVELIFDKMVRALRGSASTAIYEPAIGVVDGYR